MNPPVQRILKRNGDVVPFDLEKIVVAIYKAAASVGGHDRALSERLAGEVRDTLERSHAPRIAPTVEDVQDLVEKVLIENGHARTAKAYILYRHERARMRRATETSAVEYIPYKTMWQALAWAVEHDCHTIDRLNAIIREGRLPELIRAADERYEANLDQAAASILERRDELRFIIVAGPSSSGKTTTTHKLAERIEREGVHVIPMSLDNYFFDLELHPKDEFGDYDFETPEAMDLPLINEHLAELDAGRGIDMPDYDFRTGKRTKRTTRFEPEPGSLILLDTLHGLFEGLTASVPAEHKFRIYIETISQMKGPENRWIRWTDIRLLRRMIRDSQHRGYSPERTILHWHYVRRSELKHIIPHQGVADHVVNSAIPYELPFLKQRLFHYLPPFLEKWREDDKRVDGFLRARRVHRVLEAVDAIEDDSVVPAGALLREFIGGSSYEVH